MATVLVQPPLLLSKDFIDYPYWAVMAAAQAGAVLRSRDIEPELIDGLSGAGADFTSGTEQEAWLGVSRRRFLEQLDGLEGSVVIINTPPFLLAPPGRRWLGEVMAHLQGVRPALVVLAEMYMGGMHHLDLDPASWLPDLAGDPLLLRFECEPLLERLANELQHNADQVSAITGLAKQIFHQLGSHVHRGDHLPRLGRAQLPDRSP